MIEFSSQTWLPNSVVCVPATVRFMIRHSPRGTKYEFPAWSYPMTSGSIGTPPPNVSVTTPADVTTRRATVYPTPVPYEVYISTAPDGLRVEEEYAHPSATSVSSIDPTARTPPDTIKESSPATPCKLDP